MPDVYATIAVADRAVQEELSRILELRAAVPGQQALREAYLARLDLRSDAHVLEVGCGTGSVCRRLAELVPDGVVVGVDPSPVFLEKARELSVALPNLAFEAGDARSLPFADDAFEHVVFHTTLCHVPGPEVALAEALRVLEPGGRLVVFDGDYATTTVARDGGDPLQVCLEAAVANLVHDPWLVRRLPGLVRAAGLEVDAVEALPYVETGEVTYMPTLVARGADALAAAGSVTTELAAALKDELQRRVAAGEFYGFIAYGLVLARKPA